MLIASILGASIMMNVPFSSEVDWTTYYPAAPVVVSCLRMAYPLTAAIDLLIELLFFCRRRASGLLCSWGRDCGFCLLWLKWRPLAYLGSSFCWLMNEVDGVLFVPVMSELLWAPILFLAAPLPLTIKI